MEDCFCTQNNNKKGHCDFSLTIKTLLIRILSLLRNTVQVVSYKFKLVRENFAVMFFFFSFDSDVMSLCVYFTHFLKAHSAELVYFACVVRAGDGSSCVNM